MKRLDPSCSSYCKLHVMNHWGGIYPPGKRNITPMSALWGPVRVTHPEDNSSLDVIRQREIHSSRQNYRHKTRRSISLFRSVRGATDDKEKVTPVTHPFWWVYTSSTMFSLLPLRGLATHPPSACFEQCMQKVIPPQSRHNVASCLHSKSMLWHSTDLHLNR